MSIGTLFVLSAPSGAGKSTLCHALAQRRGDVRLSVSCTTRPPREGEREGVDYYFVTESDFGKKLDRGEFLEWAQVHGHLYGTPKGPIESLRAQGYHVFLNIDTVGARSIKKMFYDCVLIFVAPPSWKALEERLRRRNKDDEATIQRRLANAHREAAQVPFYDYLLVNDRLERALDDLMSVVQAESCRVRRLHLEPDGLPKLGFERGGEPRD
ncbi:MAG: guanylate kinase [Elusimicrobia bacterium]|nr:guanylate kinase [Elusimicrobiota bacterium]MBP9127619.1 guanylate kinase [Elusimicrobiota bacterium]MBP9699254.1 guanylate kinase [Elusimicrobiota bacterium]